MSRYYIYSYYIYLDIYLDIFKNPDIRFRDNREKDKYSERDDKRERDNLKRCIYYYNHSFSIIYTCLFVLVIRCGSLDHFLMQYINLVTHW